MKSKVLSAGNMGTLIGEDADGTPFLPLRKAACTALQLLTVDRHGCEGKRRRQHETHEFYSAESDHRDQGWFAKEVSGVWS